MTATGIGTGIRAIEPDWYRRVLGQYPTGVCVVAADEPDAGPCGMVVGSFTSVSLDPPLIAFYPAKSSTSWPRIQAAGAFCVNILGADQEDICRIFSAKAGNKFEQVGFHPAAQTGSPIIDGVVAWIDCDIEAVQDAGDHVLVLGRVRELDVHRPGLPLLFFQGGYGRFSPHSLAASASDAGGSLTTPLRCVDLIRPLLEDLAKDLRCRCLAGARIADEVIIVASAGYSRDSIDATTPVGQRLPYLPPSGSIFAAWDGDDEQERWLRHAPAAAWEQHRGALRLVRERGYSLGLLSPAQREFASALEAMAHQSASEQTSLSDLIPQLSYDPPELSPETLGLVRQITAPVFDADGQVALALTIFGYGAPPDGSPRLIEALLAASAAATRRIGGQVPAAPAA
jgi:flavin reductase (DIM6/NTAB) family NADH-FMN oxidoreductase RutF/DNA-binding IclR family transcriptional regulator